MSTGRVRIIELGPNGKSAADTKAMTKEGGEREEWGAAVFTSSSRRFCRERPSR